MADENPGGNPQGEPGNEPGDGSQRKAWEPPTDGSWIPKARFDDAQNALKIENARLQAQLDASKPKPNGEDKPERTYTRAELDGLVAEGKITQEAADTYWRGQERKAITREVVKEVRTEISQRQRDEITGTALAEYRELVPAAWEPGSKERGKVAKEYAALVKIGFAEDKATEVAAMRAAFGDPETIRESRATGRRGPGETHVETGGGEKPGAGAGGDDGPPKGLDAKKVTYYQKQIDKGIYPDWKAVRTELAYKPPKRS